MKNHLRNRINRNAIRIIDVLLSLVAIVFTFPILVVVTVVLIFHGEKPLFFQSRVGKGSKDFTIIKFSTMIVNSESVGDGIYTAEGDRRITPPGRILRKYKVNEFPQFLNILCGDMSFVGPRPLIRRTFNLYSQSNQTVISSTRPGLTGVASIVFAQEAIILKSRSNDTCIEDFYASKIAPIKEDLEVWYTKNYSLLLYIELLLLTPIAVISPKLALNSLRFMESSLDGLLIDLGFDVDD